MVDDLKKENKNGKGKVDDLKKDEIKVEENKGEVKVEENKGEVKVEEKKGEVKVEEKKGEDDKKKVDAKKNKEPIKKDIAVANGDSLRISPKHSFAICKVIRGKSPDAAVERLEAVISKKRSIPMAGREVAHQRGKGISGAKFPKNACVEIISIVKQVKANASVVGIENPIIVIAKADRASAPFRRGGRKAKRTHIHLEVRDKSKLVRAKK